MMENQNEAVDRIDYLRDKYIHLSRYLKTPISIEKIKFFDWIGLIFSALSTSYFLHWGLTAPLFYALGDSINESVYVLEWCGYVIVWPIFLITTLIGLQFSVSFYTSTYSKTAEKAHDRAEKKSKNWFQNLFIFEKSLDNLFIRLTGIFGMIMISYGAVSNFNDMLARDAEIRIAQKTELNKYSNLEELEGKLKYWTDRQINGKNDDDAAANAMVDFYTNQIKLYSTRSDSLNKIVYNKADIQMAKTIDVTASIKFVSQGSEVLFSVIMIILLGIIAAANDGSVANMTKTISLYDQAEQAQSMYERERRIMENLVSGNESGNWLESGSAANEKANFRGGKNILELDSAKRIIYAFVQQKQTGTFKSNRKLAKYLGYTHSWVNEVLKAWKSQQQKEAA